MSGWSWFWIGFCVVFWIAFSMLVRETGKLGMKSYKLGSFWFLLVSLSVLTVLVFLYVVEVIGIQS